MTQDCLNSPSTADVSKRLPKGINITGADKKSDPGIEGMPWGYLFIHNKTAQVFEKKWKPIIRKSQFFPCLFYPSFLHIQTKERERRSKERIEANH